MKRVVIVGAGPCGLTALKEMVVGGHDAILFERSNVLGGIFSSAAMYPDLHLTISNWAMGKLQGIDTRLINLLTARLTG